jgi:hypothetical protein
MPTPFTHLEIAQRLLRDESIPASVRDLLHAEQGAFLLGSVAPDARVGSGVAREDTHFYLYGEQITEPPWRVMMARFPSLLRPHSDAHRGFVAGYVAHLSVDEIWSRRMVGPHFAGREWGDRAFRFYMLHIILIYMDERDLSLLEGWQPAALRSARPAGWLPFAGDDDLRSWQKLIYDQIKASGESRTLEIFGGRIGRQPADMRAFLDAPEQMQRGLWDHIAPSLLAEVEREMYNHARQQLMIYFDETQFPG